MRPKLVIAVACERDLVTGINDSFPLIIYGVFNIRENGPCIDTTVSFIEIERLMKKVLPEGKN